MKTLTQTILVTEEVKNAIQSHPYLMSSDYNFQINFQTPEKAEIDPFEGMDNSKLYYEMTASLNVQGWISIGEIIERTSL